MDAEKLSDKQHVLLELSKAYSAKSQFYSRIGAISIAVVFLSMTVLVFNPFKFRQNEMLSSKVPEDKGGHVLDSASQANYAALSTSLFETEKELEITREKLERVNFDLLKTRSFKAGSYTSKTPNTSFRSAYFDSLNMERKFLLDSLSRLEYRLSNYSGIVNDAQDSIATMRQALEYANADCKRLENSLKTVLGQLRLCEHKLEIDSSTFLSKRKRKKLARQATRRAKQQLQK